jgi:hypothetical protein
VRKHLIHTIQTPYAWQNTSANPYAHPGKLNANSASALCLPYPCHPIETLTRQLSAQSAKLTQDVVQRIHHYDKLANDNPSEPSLLNKWFSTSGKWMLTSSLGFLGDQYISNSLNHRFENFYTAHSLINPVPSGYIAKSYNQLLGLGVESTEFGKGGDLLNYRQLFTRLGFSRYVDVLKRNFRCFLQEKITPRALIQETMLNQNFQSLISPLRQGQYFTSFARIIGLSLVLYYVLKQTKTTYQHCLKHHLPEEETTQKTLKTFIGQALKSAICWEVAGIGAAFGSAVFCIGTVPRATLSILSGGLISAMVYKGLSKLIPVVKIDNVNEQPTRSLKSSLSNQWPQRSALVQRFLASQQA